MYKRIPIKNHQQEIQLTAKRTMLALAIICFLISLLVLRLAYLQITKHNVYSTLSTKNWLDLVPIEPTRGLIYDRNGVLLTENIPVFSLDIIPVQVTELNKTIAALKKIIVLSDNDISQFRRQLRQHRRFDEIPLKLRLTEEEVARFAENQFRFPGVLIKARLMRYYPYGKSFSHVLGYVGRINAQELSEIDQTNYSASHYIGKLGIEKYYEEELHGKVGYEEVENDANGKPIRVIKEIKGTPGKNIYLTLDSGLQFAAEKALSGHNGAVVAIQPATGQILAMVSEPGYDPNLFVLGISQKDYQALQGSEDRPLYNRALRGLYPFASTIKPFYALQGLDTGVVTPTDTIWDPGWFQLPNSSHRFHDHRRGGHGTVNLSKAIITSCDIYFYELANKMGIRRMGAILNQFGFGTLTGIDLDDELPGIVASPEWKRRMKGERWYDGDTIISAIGQGFMQATPLQLAAATATLANRGQRFMPFLLLGEQLPGKAYVSQQPISLDPVTLQDDVYWDIVIKAMQDVVASPGGTAYRAFGPHNYTYTIAAKTGTAQVSRRRNPDEQDKQENLPEKLRDHNLFIAFAPADKPKIALAIITEHSHVAAETARAIFDYYLGTQQNVTRHSPNKIEKTPA
ncbi:penicillin-binding protein 2 [Aquicella lusitana]|uniref:Peptidoglycan D,D-transpeptidase MrdA n=1 Tax=Aquicella lusitana TaxID=254246 RepID=A0A370GGR0_9COXI|nr:penicillin-binding protein 2 [Aquicella lusitana]RDI42851.1 peptidoglycan glycosyltransferase [Aquicella lusitana]VVC73094.1 Penicillin-binding protein 2 [Aquicella lusitana]